MHSSYGLLCKDVATVTDKGSHFAKESFNSESDSELGEESEEVTFADLTETHITRCVSHTPHFHQ